MSEQEVPDVLEVIYKYPFTITDHVVVSMPAGATVVHAAAPAGPRSSSTLTLWARVDPHAPVVDRRFELRGTGQPLGTVGMHIATIQDGPFVWHLFEPGNEPTK